jgi:hypothetical protein
MNQSYSHFKCVVCGLPVDPSNNNVERLGVVWLKSNGKTVNRVVEELHSYKHDFCNDKGMTDYVQDALF